MTGFIFCGAQAKPSGYLRPKARNMTIAIMMTSTIPIATRVV
jgi:hypothetical protein